MARSPSNSTGITSVALIGSYVPRQCGIATFTKDLREAMAGELGNRAPFVLAMDDRPAGYAYPAEVRFQVQANQFSDYRLATNLVNINRTDVSIVQHEYGIFGGSDGSYVLEFMERLTTPVITTLHTVLREPSPNQAKVLSKIAEVSDCIVVMSHRATQFLKEVYGVPNQMIEFIPHGVPDVAFVDPSFYKDQFAIENRTLLLTYGLLSEGKGIQFMLQAMPQILQRFPNVVYVVVGATHPNVVRDQGEAYRNTLEQMVDSLGIRPHVVFDNRFVSLDELVRYMGAADVYVTPYLNEAQITSGTLAQALGAGKAVISTPYWYAQEMLADGRGCLVPFQDSDALADAVIRLLQDPVQRNAMRKRAYMHGRSMIWKEVARSYLQLGHRVIRERSQKPRPVFPLAPDAAPTDSIPAIRFDHIRTLSDDTGILQTAVYATPERRHGYATEDNARALVAAIVYDDLRRDKAVMALITTYLAFLYDAFDVEKKHFRPLMSYDRRWTNQRGSDACQGRCVWALGLVVKTSRDEDTAALASRLFADSLPHTVHTSSPIASAFSLIGIQAYLSRYGGDTLARRARQTLARDLSDQFQAHATDNWPWCGAILQEDSARVAQALILSGQHLPAPAMCQHGLRMLRWLLDLQLSENSTVSLIGDQGWLTKDGRRARFNQRPTDAMSLIEACAEAYRYTGDRQWVQAARTCLGWFLGRNDTGSLLYDYHTGGCRDCLSADGANSNEGAAATAAWLISLITIHDLVRSEGVARPTDHVAAKSQPAVTHVPQ